MRCYGAEHQATPVIAVVAVACVSLNTFGTETCAGPLETTRLTAEPPLTLVAAVGVSLITSPEATVLLEAGSLCPAPSLLP